MSLYYVERRPWHIGRFQLPPLFSSEVMKSLSPGDKLSIAGQEITVMDHAPDRQTPDKLLVGDQVISVAERGSRFPPQGDQFITIRHVRAIDF